MYELNESLRSLLIKICLFLEKSLEACENNVIICSHFASFIDIAYFYKHKIEAEQSANTAKENCATMSHPYRNTLPQYNSVARCKLFAIQNCTILTYVAPFFTIPGQKLL